MSVDPEPWVQHDIELRNQHKFDVESEISRFMQRFSAFAVSNDAQPGDLVALADGVGAPVVLRAIDGDRERFKFPSCAWFICAEPTIDYQWDRIDAELRGIWPLHTRKHRPAKEVFKII